MTLCLRGKVFSALLLGLGAILCSSPAFATQITFSTAQSTPRLYTLTAADLASYDPGGTFGIYDDTVCDTGTIATLHGGTANMDGGSPDTIYYTPPGGYVGSDTVTFFNTIDGANCVAQQAIVNVYGPLSITTTTLPVPVYLVAYSQTIATTGGLAPITFSRIAGALPLGVALSSAGLLHGTASAGAYSFTIRAVDANANQSTQAYSGTVASPPTIATATLPTPVLNAAYNQPVTTTGGTAPIAFSISSGSLPAGLIINSASGVISGTPTAAGAYNFTVRALDANSLTGTRSYSGTIAASLAIATAALPTPVLNVPYNHTVATTGGTAPVTFSVTAGALPGGLAINSASGVVSGTPTTAGAYNFTVHAVDANSVSVDQTYSGTIEMTLLLATTSLPTPVLGQAYSLTLTTTGGTPPITFGLNNGTLPTGLTLSISGVISGTPSASGSFSFTIYAADATSASFRTFNITVAPSLTISTATLPAPLLGVAYSQAVTATGGTAPITFSVTAGALPAGLSINSSSGVVSGTPTAAGAYSFTVRAVDASSTAVNQAYSGSIVPSVAIASVTLPTPLLGVAYSQTIATTGGTAPITFSLTAGALPAGLSINSSSGVVSGTPTAAGAYNFTVHAVDANSISVDQAYSGTIVASLGIATTTLPTPVLGQAYSESIATTGGTAPIAFAMSVGTLPTGLTLNTATGAIGGTPTAAGAYTFTIRATDAHAIAASQAYTGTIAASLAIATATLPTPVLGVAYAHTVTTTGGTLPIAFAISAGTLPTGFTLNGGTGTVSGTPTAAGAYAFTIRATDANAFAANQAYSGTIAAGLAISSATLPTPLLGVAYAHTVTTTGGTLPIAFAIATGTLPAGLTLNAGTGALTGTPISAGAYAFTIRVTDANAITASQAYSGTVVAGLAIATGTLPAPAFGVAYSQVVTTAGGTAPIAFAIAAGALPTGLTLNTATGAISGTATAAGAYTFSIRATDANSITANQAYSGTIAASLTISSAALATPVIDVAYTGTITTTGGTAPIAFAISAGTLPAGLTLNTATGAISGTATTAGTYTFTIRATDANAIAVSQTDSGTIAATLTIATATLPTPAIGVLYSQTIATTGGTLPIAFSVSAGTLPVGLTLNSATGVLSGTPTTAGAYTFTLRATDANAITASQAYAGTIGAVPSLTGLSPNSGPLAGGSNVSIIGTAFTGATAVLFGSTPATSFTVLSATAIAAISPAGSGSALVSVIAPGGTSPMNAVATFTWTAPPAITSISPDSGAFAGGTVVTITGHGFTHATAVYFGSIAAATFSVTSDTSISATTAAASAGAAPASSAVRPANARNHPTSATSSSNVSVTVVTAAGTSPPAPAATYIYMPAVVPVPTVARLSPASGTSAGGTSVTITGTALNGATAVRFGTAAATFTVTNSTTLRAVAPAGIGTVNVTVTTPGGTSAAGSAAYTYKAAATTVVLTSSSNPAAARTPVTFTATVGSTGATPAGTVRFKDGATVIATVALAGGGIAELTISTLTIGTHAIEADYAGNARFAPSTSAPLAQAISVPADSQKLRALQLAASKLVAQASGQAISSAVDDAISDGFSGNTPLISPSSAGVKLNIAEAGSRHKAATQAPVGVPGAPGALDATARPKNHSVFDTPVPPNTSGATKPTMPREWLVWADVQRTGITHTGSAAATTIYGDQINALAGLTRKVSPNFLFGVLGGYETFDYRDDALAGRLTGNGTTVGAYIGWKFMRGLRFDLAGAHSAIGYDGVAGTAAGAFAGSRSLVSSGLIGTYAAAAFAVEPSAKIYALWESQAPYVDSLGTPQTISTFTTGRTSAGAKISTLPKTESFIAPFAGFYADYYFNGDNAAAAASAAAIPLASEKILAGWSARAIAGFALRLRDETTVTCGAEYGGIGSNTVLVKYRCDAGVPFLRARRVP